MAFIDNLSEATRSRFSPGGTAKRARPGWCVGEGTGGRWAGPSEPPAERPVRTWTPRPAFRSHRGSVRLSAPQPAGRHCQQELPRRPSSPGARPSRQEGLEGRAVHPPVRWPEREESARLQLPTAFLFLQPRHQGSSPLAPRLLEAHKEGWAVAATASASGQMASSARSRSQKEGVEPGCGEL